MNRKLFLGSFLISLFVSANHLKAAQGIKSMFPAEGVYSGFITMNGSGEKIPLDLSYHYTEQEIPGASDEMLQFKKNIMGNFLLASEAAYSLQVSSYDIEDGLVDLQYYRAMTAVTGLPPNLRFQGYLQSDGSISGNVISKGIIGKFNVVRNNDLSDLTPKDVTVGEYTGTWTPDDKTLPPYAIKLTITPSGASQTNPSDYELDFTPGRSGHLISTSDNGVTELFLTQIVIDYLRSTIRMTYIYPTTNAPTILIGTIRGDTIQGSGGRGHFSVRRSL